MQTRGSMGRSRQILFSFHQQILFNFVQQILFSVRTKGSMGRSRQILSSQATAPCSMSHLGSSNPHARWFSDFLYIGNSSFLARRSLFVGTNDLSFLIQVDITWFPFDDQDCDLKFGSWTYSGWKVRRINPSFIYVFKIWKRKCLLFPQFVKTKT